VYPRQFASHVEVHLKDGRTLSRSTLDPHGTPADPCSVDEQIGKFRNLARLSGIARDLSDAIDIVRTLESRQVSELMRELR